MSFNGRIPIIFGLLVYFLVRAVLRMMRQKKKNRIQWFKELIGFSFVLYLLMLVSVTLFPLEIGVPHHDAFSYRSLNFIPILSIIRDISQVGIAYSGDSAFMIMLIVRNVGGNILMFMPFGFLAPFVSTRFKTLKKTMLTALLLSLSIESLQLVELVFSIGWGRTVDIDDIICNVSGAVFGYYIYKLMNLLFGKRKESVILVKGIEK